MSGPGQHHDNELKERVARVLFSQGYLCRFNVDVIGRAPSAGKEVFTDLDVLGIRFDELLRPDIVVVECKSGVNVSTKDRMFWLHGVRQRYGAKRGVFVRSQVDTSTFVHDYDSLGLSIFSSETLETLELANSAGIYERLAPVSKGSAQELHKAHETCKQLNKDHARYVGSGYWHDAVGLRLDNLLTILRSLRGNSADFCRLNALSLLAVTVVQIAGDVSQYPAAKWPQALRSVISGAINLSSQERILSGIHAYVSEEIKARTGKQWGVSKEAMVHALDPQYLPELGELVERFLRNPAARLIPQAIDIAAFPRPDLAPVDYGEYPLCSAQVSNIRRGIRDLLVFAERADALSKPDVSRVQSVIDPPPLAAESHGSGAAPLADRPTRREG